MSREVRGKEGTFRKSVRLTEKGRLMALTAELMKNLAGEIDKIAHQLNPDKTTPLYGDISDYLAREKADARLPVSFDTYRYIVDIHKPARNASIDLLNLHGELEAGVGGAASKVRTYFERNDSNLATFLNGLKDLLEKLPDPKGITTNVMDPSRRASFSLGNILKLVEMMIADVRDGFDGKEKEPSGKQGTGDNPFVAKTETAGPPKPEAMIRYDDAEAKYLQKIYTLAEFIICLNLPQSVRRKYIDVEICESQYSFIQKDELYEEELRKNVKQYIVAEAGPFPFVSLAVFVKEFSNLILLSTLSYNERKVSGGFFGRYGELKQATKDLMERIVGMPRTDMKSSVALAFLRKEVVPIANAWIKDVANSIIASQSKYHEEIGILARGLVNRINKIYQLEKM